MPSPRPPAVLPAEGFNEIASCRHGPMLFNKNDQYVGASLRKYGEFSPDESQMFRQIVRPGMTVVEAGANIGAHTIELSRLVEPGGAVVAIEPQRLVFQTLCANVALNSRPNVLALQIAVGAEDGTILVPVLPPGQFGNFGGVSLTNVQQGESVSLRRLDTIGLAHCHVIKLDVEGMEVEALRGAEALIARHRPTIYAENDREERTMEMLSLLWSWNYKVFVHTPPLYSPANFAGDPENLWPGIVSLNILCLPAERAVVVKGLEELTPE